jgi:ADP-ribosylglycohydrolase
MQNLKEKYASCLVGCAIGDTLGMPVETWPRERIKRYYGRITKPTKQKIILDEKGNEVKEDEFGKIKYWARNLETGEYTDDTILTLPLAESIIKCQGINLEDIAKRYLHEIEIRTLPDGKITGGFGGTTKQALRNLKIGASPLESGVIGGPGNAPPMKIAPLGLYMDSQCCYSKGLVLSEQIARITHLDPR